MTTTSTFKTRGGNTAKNQKIEWNPEYIMFISYDTNIVKKTFEDGLPVIYLDQKYWNYSKTTSIYRSQFLGETTKETQSKIDSGKYILTDLN